MHSHKKWVSETFDRTAVEYGKKSSSFFNYFGKRLVAHVNVLPGQQVLDIATGRGAVLFPLAEAVGSSGRVVGIDISPHMIRETSKEAGKMGLSWVEFICMDAEQLDFPDNSFDFVFCGFGLFFLPSIPTALAEWKRVLKPNGKLVVSTWGEDSVLDTLINSELKEIYRMSGIITTPLWSDKALSHILQEALFTTIQTFEETQTFVHKTAEEWWESLWTHATRAQLEQLSPAQVQNLRKIVLAKASYLDKGAGIAEELQVFYATAQKKSDTI
jgi:ubiquinone/menaquinone biosynthesis C-methylase UbiE